MKRVYDIDVMTWKEFERLFLDIYFGEVAKHAKRMEFEHLIHRTMLVLEYESRFLELSRFAMGMISEKGEKTRRMKFKHLIQGTMSVLKYESCFAELSRFAMGMRGWILLEYVMVVGWEITYGGLAH